MPDPIFQKKLSIATKSFMIKVPLPNEKGTITMLNLDYTAKLLNLEDVMITNVENLENEVHIHLELPRKEHVCPCCGATTNIVHDYRTQVIKDVPLGRKTLLHLRKRRYRCPDCGKRFYETNTFLPRYYRITRRMLASVLNAFQKLHSAADIAKRYNISASTAIRYFDCIDYHCRELPEVLSIDEFKGNAGGEKYQSIVTDPKNRKVLDILPNRFEGDLIQYFKHFPHRDQVKLFVSDMNPHFRSVAKICFPNAKIVADRYHVTRQAIWAMENVRKAEQKKLSVRFRTYFKRSKSLLNRPVSKLTSAEKEQLALMFEISPKLAAAYRLKNAFLKIMHSNSKTAKPLLSQWLLDAENSGLSEFRSCITAYQNWSEEILNSLDVPWSNGFTEGCNNKTKVLKRVCFGVRNFARFRNRILHLSLA
jgi:transposase